MGTYKTLCLLAILSQTSAGILTSPPRIVKQPPVEEILYQVALPKEAHKPFIIECEAEGEPSPKYRWQKNGKEFVYHTYDNRISQQLGRGTLYVSEPNDQDLGQYQCFAENEWGTATSNSVFVRKSELNSFNNSEAAPKTVKAQEGKPFTLVCVPPDGYPKPKVYWMLQDVNGQIKSINDSRMTIDPEGNLHFSYVMMKDTSVDFAYTCAVRSLFRHEYKFGNKIYLVVEAMGGASTQNKHELQQMYVTRKQETVLKGKRTEIFCIFGGKPLPEVIWSKNGEEIRFSNDIVQDNYGKTLVIKKTEYSDAGSYTCEISNGVGTPKSYSVKLSVDAVPFFIEEPMEQNKAEGETAIFRCTADGTPKPAIQWIHNGKPIREGISDYPRRTVTADYIEIRDLVKSDTGNYGCNATNSVGYVYKDVYVNVQSIAPEIKERPTELVMVDGQTAVLRCRVFGAPKPIVKWMRDNVDVTGGKYNTTADGDLVITDVTFTDAGKYQCYASNKLGNDTAFGSLTVKKHTVITTKPTPYEVAAGSDATFRCNANADPSLHLEIIWLSNGEPIDFVGRFRMTSDYSLYISDTVELDSGLYTCIAKTEIDNATAQATLIVQDKPNAPVLESMFCSNGHATVRWHDMGDNRASILRYTIQYNTSFTPDNWDVASDDVPRGDRSWDIQLSPWANYTFRVIAWNKIGPSPPSPHSAECRTAPDVPHKNPDNVRGHGTEPTNMLISWTPMAQIDHNGPGFYYQASWRSNITGSPWNDVTIRDWRQSEYIVRPTPTFQPYRIKVIAINSLGTSNVSPVEIIGWSGEDTPLQAPGNFSLVVVTSGKTAVLKWDPVTPESVRGHFKGYKIQAWTDDEDTIKEFPIPELNSTQAVVSIFTPFKKNYARIMAYNEQYNGPPSDTLQFVTPEDAPGPVRSFEAYPIGSSAMILKWDKPENENGVLTGYKISYQTMVGTEPGPIEDRKKEIDPQFDRAKLAGLQPGTQYNIMIRAKTKVGEGEPMAVTKSTFTEVASLPVKPIFETKVLSGKDHGTAHMLVRWLPSFDGHAGSEFSVEYKLKGHPDWSVTPKVTEDDYVIVTGLEPGKLYEVRITAYDADYYSSSDIQDVDTTIDGPLIMRDDKMATAGWFIGVMLALAFLLLVLVVVCVVRRNRGGKYDVHDRELAHGRRDYPDPQGFHEYTHPIDNKSRHSMSSGTKPGPESDTDSMAEYGEGETGRFTEDGSFIGQYVPGARVLPPAPHSPPAPAPRSNQPPTYV